jgi:hypothetical protein
MPGKAANTTITKRRQEIVQTLSRSSTALARLRQRASIMVLAFDVLLNQENAERVGPTHRQVGHLGRRWADRPLPDILAPGTIASFFVSPYAQLYYFPILVIPLLVLLADRLPQWTGAVLLATFLVFLFMKMFLLYYH